MKTDVHRNVEKCEKGSKVSYDRHLQFVLCFCRVRYSLQH